MAKQPTLQDVFDVTPDQLAEMTPPQIDALNSVMYGEFGRIRAELDKAWDRLYDALLLRKEPVRSGNGFTQQWPMYPGEAEKLARFRIEEGFEPDQRTLLRHGIRGDDGYATGLKGALARIDGLRADIARLDDGPRKVLDAEYVSRGGWSRFVTVPDGHMHRGRQCHTIGPRTHTDWHPELSGRSEDEAVAAHGPYLCTHCYRDAPTEWKLNPAEEKKKGKARGYCLGSGEYVELSAAMARRVSKYAQCPRCEDRPSVTSTWKLRAHKPKGLSA